MDGVLESWKAEMSFYFFLMVHVAFVGFFLLKTLSCHPLPDDILIVSSIYC